LVGLFVSQPCSAGTWSAAPPRWLARWGLGQPLYFVVLFGGDIVNRSASQFCLTGTWIDNEVASLFRIPCPWVLDKNNIMEHKYHHIVEVGLSHAFMPLKYRDEAFLAIEYLINYLPSKVVQNSTSLDRLLHSQNLDYSSLCTFGCAC
jgi:hypothetical protein